MRRTAAFLVAAALAAAILSGCTTSPAPSQNGPLPQPSQPAPGQVQTLPAPANGAPAPAPGTGKVQPAPGTVVSNPPPAPGGPAEPANPAVAAGNQVAALFQAMAQGQPVDSFYAPGAPRFTFDNSVRGFKFLETQVEKVSGAGMLLAVKLFVTPASGEAKEMTFYAAMVQENGAWQVNGISPIKP